jgi:hypothetical protein
VGELVFSVVLLLRELQFMLQQPYKHQEHIISHITLDMLVMKVGEGFILAQVLLLIYQVVIHKMLCLFLEGQVMTQQ